jgi:hypothetical protein
LLLLGRRPFWPSTLPVFPISVASP